MLLMLLILSLSSIVAVYILFPESRGQQAGYVPAPQPVPVRDGAARPAESQLQV